MLTKINTKAIFCDIYGVIHNGKTLLDGSQDLIDFCTKNQIELIFVSNAQRISSFTRDFLKKMGLVFDNKIITAADTFINLNKQLFLNKNLYYIGKKLDQHVIDMIGAKMTNNPNNADFLIISDNYSESDSQDILNDMKILSERNIHGYCINPDLMVFPFGGKVSLCAGNSARIYEYMGGKVFFYGKPYEEIYYHAKDNLPSNITKNQIVAIGDSLSTDILGASNFGIKSILVTTGISTAKSANESTVKPDFIINSLSDLLI